MDPSKGDTVTFKIITFLLNYCIKKLSKYEGKQTARMDFFEDDIAHMEEQIEFNQQQIIEVNRERSAAMNLRKKLQDLA